MRQNDGTVNNRDRILALALQAYEDSICPGCHLPHSVTRGDENVGRVEWKDDGLCHGCSSQDNLREDKSRLQFPGQKIYPVINWE